MKTFTHKEVLDHILGRKGSKIRDEYEAETANYLEKIAKRGTCELRKLTQDESIQTKDVTDL
jgi:predicted ThiF/HesA family dinucleotide-utilizing enzyme